MNRHTISVVLPYFNELDFIRTTLESCLAQARLPDQLILVDNASTDGSAQLCREILQDPRGMEVVYLHEPKPGYVNALVRGIASVNREFVAIWNADTWYPPHYFATCDTLLSRSSEDVIALMARDIYQPPNALRSRLVRYVYSGLSWLRPKMSFTGSFGQILRTSAVKASGGYSVERWPYTMEDHELIHRICKLGRTRAHPDLWCMPSPRRHDRSGINWTLAERMLYFFTPYSWGDWFFYRFLESRFAKRKMMQTNLRAKDWDSSPSSTPQPHVILASAACKSSSNKKRRQGDAGSPRPF